MRSLNTDNLNPSNIRFEIQSIVNIIITYQLLIILAEEIHFPVFGSNSSSSNNCKIVLVLMYLICVIMTVL